MNNFFLETIKAQDGNLFHLEYHQKRYESVLNALNAKHYKHLKDVLNAPNKGLIRCRVLYSKNTLEVSYHPYIKKNVQKLKLIFDDSIEYSKKYADRTLLNEYFMDKGSADDILIIRKNLVTDTSIANIAFFDGERWITPKEPLLKGTTRERLLENKKIFEEDIKVNELKNYKKVALLNAMIDFDIISEDKIKVLYC